MKDGLGVNEWECIYLEPQDLLRDAYWINRAWRLDLEWSTQAVFVMTSLIAARPVSTLDGAAGFLSTSSNHNPGEQQELWVCLSVCLCVCVCVVVCICVSCLSVSLCVLGMNPLLE